MSAPLRILHLTDASSAGVLHAAGGLARRQAELGADVTFAYIRRDDSPPPEEISAMLHPAAAVEFGRESQGLVARVRSMRRFVSDAVSTDAPGVIHAHSSLAGAALRLALPLPGFTGVRAYSPHGFAFLRQDVPRVVRAAFAAAEWWGARTGIVVAASPSEERLAQRRLRPRRTAIVVNGAPARPRAPRPSTDASRPVVGIVGRITFQKAPWRFARLARELSDRADFVWIGDGSDADRRRWLEDAPVTVTGWLAPDEVADRLSQLSVFLFPTLWEGMPLALLEAQSTGVPAVATRIVGNEDIVQDGVTGFLADTDEELRERLIALLADADLRRTMAERAREQTARRFDVDVAAAHSLVVYGAAASG